MCRIECQFRQIDLEASLNEILNFVWFLKTSNHIVDYVDNILKCFLIFNVCFMVHLHCYTMWNLAIKTVKFQLKNINSWFLTGNRWPWRKALVFNLPYSKHLFFWRSRFSFSGLGKNVGEHQITISPGMLVNIFFKLPLWQQQQLL